MATVPGKTMRVTVQTKVLLVVLAFLVALPLLLVWIVGRQTSELVLDQARQALTTADTGFRNTLEIRSNDVLAAYRNMVSEPAFRATLTQNDAPTTSAYLASLLRREGQESEALLFYPTPAEPAGGAHRDNGIALEAFGHLAQTLIAPAFDGDARQEKVSFNDRAYTLVAMPVTYGQGSGVNGVLAAGIRINDTALRELKDQIGAEVVLVADGRVIASTLSDPSGTGAWLAQVPPARRGAPREITPVLVGGEHFLALSVADTPEAPSGGLRYVLLSSYEKSVRSLEDTRQTLVDVSAIAIILSAIVVGLLVRRITQPLRELRDSAEAVGRGDFSRRVVKFSNDECGEVAEAFNRMTTNLQSSHAELNRTVDTLKATQAQLVQSEKLSAVGQFVAGVAHELNNPLTTVIGFSELLAHIESDEKIRHQLGIINKSAHRCHKIVQSLLSFARQHPPERRLVEINGVIDEVLEIMAYDLRTSNIQIAREFGESLPPLLGDAHQLQQVFVNILGNARQAIQAAQPEGRITIRTSTAAGKVRIDFADNGPGIRPEHVTRIFDPFFTTKPVGKGTGLGLSLTYGIIQEHAGTIRVESVFGQGATFVIELPVANTAQVLLTDSRSPIVPAALRPAPSGGRRVLVIDDETWILDLAREILISDGHTVETAVGGESALRILAGQKFDVIVCDWKMPGLNGMRLYEQLLATDPASASRMLFMTGDIINDTFQQFLERNHRACMPKPFAIEDFRTAVGGIAAERN